MGEGTRVDRDCQVAREEGKPSLEPEAPGDPSTFRHDAPVQHLASDKTALLKATLEWRLRSAYPESRIDEFPWSETNAAGSDAPCRRQLQTSSAASTGAGVAGSAESPIGAPMYATKVSRFVCA
jgi:hypothetical protein